MATFLLGIGGDAELPLRSGVELACSGSSQWVSGLAKRNGRRGGVLAL
jgi:hypothetical protein